MFSFAPLVFELMKCIVQIGKLLEGEKLGSELHLLF